MSFTRFVDIQMKLIWFNRKYLLTFQYNLNKDQITDTEEDRLMLVT